MAISGDMVTAATAKAKVVGTAALFFLLSDFVFGG